MLIHQYIENAASRYPDKVAIIQDDQRTTYNQLNVQVNRLCTHLQKHGITKGERIALLLENSVDYVIAYYAIVKAGAVAAPLNPGLKPDGLQYLLDHLEPVALITSFKSERLLKAIDTERLGLKLLVIRTPKQMWSNTPFTVTTTEESLSEQTLMEGPEIEANDLASIIYTSGSTGKPKGVMLSHRNIDSNTASICQYLDLSNNDIQMVVLPFFYVMGKSLLNTHMSAGATVVLNNRFMYPADVVKQMIQENITGFSGVPSTYAYLLNRSPLAKLKDRLKNLRYCSQAGGHMSKSLKQALRSTLPKHTQIVIMYGATEAAARLTYLEPAHFESKIESIGKPIPNVTIRIIDMDGQEVPDGEEGELVAQGANIMRGYWKDPDDTARFLTPHGYRTGDIGYRDKDGFLFIKRRKDDLLKVGGHRINPIEIEDFLMETDLIIESKVVGLPDSLLGNRLIALVVPKSEDLDPTILMETCANGLPTYKTPAQIIPTRTLPKNANGKIDSSKCQELACNSQIKIPAD